MNSEIASVLERIEGTEEYDILLEMDAAYSRIAEKQQEWIGKSGFTCVEKCGKCCEHFEPDLLESEALYMAAWLLSNQPEVAKQVASGIFPLLGNNVSRETAECCVRSMPTYADLTSESQQCPFFQKDISGTNLLGHCTIYGGRAFICRLFGAAGFRDKFNKEVWKPCKFYPADKLAQVKIKSGNLEHRQYSIDEMQKMFGTAPPIMSDMMEQAETFTPDDDSSTLLHDILPKYVERLMWIMELNS